MSAFIQSGFSDGVLSIYLNRTEKYNAFIREMALAFQEELNRADADASVRAVYISGRGKAFCSGQDLAEAIDPNGPELTRIVSEHYNPIIIKMRQCMKPIVVAVNGVAAGAGANIALAGDVVVAARSATFIQAFSKIGLIPDSGGTYTLPRLIGFGKASALMMLGDKVTADEAERMGMIYKVFDDVEFATASYNIAKTLAQMPTKGLALTKKALNKSASNDLITQLKLEDELQTQAGNTHDYKEGVTAFLEKRTPKFIGK
ncbi:1,2-epoxyphenylacetyl-CoA isomerase [Thermaurantimonas aggregans]|uniref:1,2-epoxyphenylacetyl-CoA isomerase n=1 Tax=Thermaurantimonas aggregans TaxID=2173829 RepID=A0A401XLS6_9FLAO|nr:enoyl-CoA hydratase-related protein [Thermaurantimonas aggregans]GCD77944.1 1,2-epoxyphenylacetyl-CoA isomerase [Thermaurantimonas aggregans]